MRHDSHHRRDPGSLAGSLHRLGSKMPPEGLRTSLRVIASRERQRRMDRRDFASFFQLVKDRVRLSCEEMVKSVALPFAGGVCSTLVLFSMFVVPAYPLLALKFAHNWLDVPTALSTQSSVKSMAPFSAGDDDIVVDVAVDEQGRMMDYTIVSGASVLAKGDIRRRLENALVFSNFTPATSFGQPIVSRMRICFHSSRIEVKG
jgi:hypothetical protein